MKKFVLSALITLLAVTAFAEEQKTPRRYVNSLELRIINKGFDNSERTFSRLPAYLKDSVRPDLW